ncbi:selenium-dependent glutathione peroxidase [Apostichopus japonicus]|uniref:Selenium-dependent glutathione peroxidase n=1 Tax=Stichopus japonicus TaxID=307972 RepID=A0A2G8LNE9_STIJA|nr:selenium-dependent glutathione peroxidase [Apostichopus japonicus]
MNCLRYVRPGANFKPRFNLMAKVDVNGSKCHPVYKYLKQRLPLVQYYAKLGNHSCTSTPSATFQSDIDDNFEKFLINRDGKPVKRLTAASTQSELEEEIDTLLMKTSTHH